MMAFMEWWSLFAIDWNLRPSFFDYFALVLTLAGLAIAWMQLRKARSALQAADDTKDSLEYNQLLALLPEFIPSLSEIENAVQRDNAFALQRELVRFARLCNDAITLASKMDELPQEFLEQLENASIAASDLKESLILSPGTQLVAAIRPHLSMMTRVGNRATAYATELRFRTTASESRGGRSVIRTR
jgi:hypothetical protein